MAAAQIRPICCGSRLQPRLPSLLQISLISSLMDCPVHGFVSGGLRGGWTSCHIFFLSLSRPPPGMFSALDVTSSLSNPLSTPPTFRLNPRLYQASPAMGRASACHCTLPLCGLTWVPAQNCTLPPCGFHTWEERNNLYMGGHGGELGKGSGGSVRIFRASVFFFCFFSPCTECVPCREEEE